MNVLQTFAGSYPFPLDDFQLDACRALERGRSALVCAPTGAGKTVVGEFGLALALARGGKAFYTTPLKALSNQKFGDFVAMHGADSVGLLTGDNTINGEAPVVVMTTEVLRNMLYEASPTLGGLQVVVLDEVHYLRDQYRGATWEEILIHLPPEVQVVALSATLSNANEFGDWLRTVRGATDVVIEEHRPVPIEHIYMVGPRLHPMFVRERDRLVPNAALRRLSRLEPRGGWGPEPRNRHPQRRRWGPPEGHRKSYRPDRIQVVERLDEEGMLPAIVFIFSRAGCDAAVDACVAAGLELTDADERERIRGYVEMRTHVLPPEDLAVLGFARWLDGLERGIASHHAGMIPLFKETVEELFERALVKVVFATETLALGINMPARTVVIERLQKFTGERHELLSPGDYTQLTGRAGRRGMDPVGFGVTLFQKDVPFERIAALATGRSFPLVSSFRPSYNMAVNLLRNYSVDEAGRLLDLSFGQFLADRSVAAQVRRIEKNERALEGYRERTTCDRGDFAEYWGSLSRTRKADRAAVDAFRRDRAKRVRRAIGGMRPGQVVRTARGLAVVVEIRRGKRGEPNATALTAGGTLHRLGVRDFESEPEVVGEVRLPGGSPRAPRFREQVARALDRFEASPGQPRPARAARGPLASHPVHACPDRDEHVRWMERVVSLEAETERLRRGVRSRTETLARSFERVLGVLERYGYVGDGAITPKGERLARIYNESDLLVAEAIETGVFDGLSPADLAAVCSTLVYETRIGEPQAHFPNERVRRAWRELTRLYASIAATEEDHRLELVREPDPGFVRDLWAWASGEPLEEILAHGEMTPGDFVRSTKQVWDLLRQIAELGGPLEPACRDAARSIYRGVVAYSGAL